MVKISTSLPLIYLITDGTLTNEKFEQQSAKTLDLLEQAIATRIPLIQIREKQLTTKLLFELTSRAIAISRNSTTKILVNDRADVALAAGADGVHLTEISLATEVIRESFSELELIGVSTHSLVGVRNAASTGADFAVFGPVFDSPGKGKSTGIKKLKEVCAAVKPFPVLALGGIDSHNYQETLNAGAAGFAAIRFLNDPASIKMLANEGLLPGNLNNT
jgi:thiamine-phosphate pyrophosphorylase